MSSSNYSVKNRAFFYKTFKEINIILEIGFYKISNYLEDNSSNASPTVLNELLIRIINHIDKFIFNNLDYFNCIQTYDTALGIEIENSYMLRFLGVIVDFKELKNYCPTAGELNYDNLEFVSWARSFEIVQEAAESFQQEYYRETASVWSLPKNLAFIPDKNDYCSKRVTNSDSYNNQY